MEFLISCEFNIDTVRAARMRGLGRRQYNTSSETL